MNPDLQLENNQNTTVPAGQIMQECKFCKNSIPSNVFFCPSCGKKLKNPPLSTGIVKQLSLYLTSILLPPFVIVPAIAYLISKDKKAKIIGLVALILAFATSLISVIYFLKVYEQLMGQFSALYTLQGLGY